MKLKDSEPMVFREGDKIHSGQLDSDIQRQLIDYGILKSQSDGDKRVTFVGVATWNESVLLFMPKVWSHDDKHFRKDGIRLLIQTMRKYSSTLTKKYAEACFFKPQIDGAVINRLALADALIKDYLAYGLYQRKETIQTKNGRGQINWSKTVNQINPYVSNGQPIYFEYFTHSKIRDNENILRQLHHFVLKESLNSWASMLGYDSISVDHEIVTPVTQLPDTTSITTVLNRALMSTYSDRVKLLINMLKVWFDHYEHSQSNTLSLYGTSSFHTIWEKACGDIFCNKFNDWKKYIPKPHWKTKGIINEVAKNTLRPDIVRPLGRILLLLDAKYYKMECDTNQKLIGNPGVGDVSKQLFYERILRNKIASGDEYDDVLNYFIFPCSEDHLIKVDGQVRMDGLNAGPIHLIYMNIEQVLELYLHGAKIPDLSHILGIESLS